MLISRIVLVIGTVFGRNVIGGPNHSHVGSFVLHYPGNVSESFNICIGILAVILYIHFTGKSEEYRYFKLS